MVLLFSYKYCPLIHIMCIYETSIVMFLVCKLCRAAHIINGMGNNCKSKIMTIDTSSRKLWPHTIAIISTTYIYYNKAVVRYCPFKHQAWIQDRMVEMCLRNFLFIFNFSFKISRYAPRICCLRHLPANLGILVEIHLLPKLPFLLVNNKLFGRGLFPDV